VRAGVDGRRRRVRASRAQEDDGVRARGTGCVYRRTYRDRRGRRRHYSSWSIEYRLGGRLVREDGWRSRSEAEKVLRERLTARDAGRPVGPAVERTSFEDLEKLILDDYRLNERRSLARVEQALVHLREAFEGNAAVTIVERRITEYAAGRVRAGAKSGTVNRELAALRRMFRLGYKAGLVGRRPDITLLREAPARKGFFEREQLDALLAHLSQDLRAFAEALYLTGWRVDEVRTRQWRHVDLEAGWLRLEPGETKNGEGRQFPLTPRLRALLEAQKERREELRRTKRIVVPWVFWRDAGPGVKRAGSPVRHFRRAWVTACAKAGLARKVTDEAGDVVKVEPLRLVHDFRRTAVRNLERAGVPRSAAMRMVGHKTEAIYRRYAIVDEAMLREAAAKLAVLQEAEAGRTRSLEAFDACTTPAAEEATRKLVARDGIEPPTRGFSVRCSTN
jgi:integrase